MHARCWRTALAATVIVCVALSSCGDRSRQPQSDPAPAAKRPPIDRMGRWFKEMKGGDTLRIPLLALGATEKDIPQELQFLQNSDTLYNWEVKNSVARYTGYSVFQH